jgi:hypothetical protein
VPTTVTVLRRLVPLLAALLLLAPPAAQAGAGPRALPGSVAGAPETRGARVVVPVLLDAAPARRARLAAPVVRVVLPADGAIRTARAPIAPGGLRLGDRVAAEGPALPAARDRAVRPRVRARLLRVGRRSTLASFGALDAAVADARGALREALATTDRPGAVLPGRLVLLSADLRRLADALATTEHRVRRRAVPREDPGRRQAAERRALADLLAGAREHAARVADGLDVAAAALTRPQPGAADPALRTALEDALARLEGLAPPRIGPP